MISNGFQLNWYVASFVVVLKAPSGATGDPTFGDFRVFSQQIMIQSKDMSRVDASIDSSVEALDLRLRRLEYVLTGSTVSQDTSAKPTSEAESVPSQIASLSERLTKVANQNKTIKKLLQTCIFLFLLF